RQLPALAVSTCISVRDCTAFAASSSSLIPFVRGCRCGVVHEGNATRFGARAYDRETPRGRAVRGRFPVRILGRGGGTELVADGGVRSACRALGRSQTDPRRLLHWLAGNQASGGDRVSFCFD